LERCSRIVRRFTSGWTAEQPGGAVIGFDGTAFVFADAGGVESLATHGAVLCADGRKRYASVTKHAFCAMVLSHPDAISLDDTLGNICPSCRRRWPDVTVGRALDMSGGLPDTRECLSLLGLSVYTETKSGPLFDFLARQTRLNYEPGTEVSYSNTGYRLVEEALQRKGLFFRDFIRNTGARQMLHSTHLTCGTMPSRVSCRAIGTTEAKWQLSAAGLHISASGSMTGSADQPCQLAARAARRRPGAFAGVLEKSLAHRVNSPMVARAAMGSACAAPSSAVACFTGHGGSHPGYKTYFLLDPQTKCGFVVVSNREDTNGHKIAQECMAALNGSAIARPSAALTARPLRHGKRSVVDFGQGQHGDLSRCR
jgi:CubicO group peptidase (beta-lactamase class C family)